MPSEDQSYLLRFELFELDLRTRELRQQGRLIKLQDLPVRLLIFLATRQGELVTREEIEKELWGEDHFVDFDHGINTAMKKIREALEENPDSPRFVETLPRKGYRFIANIERGPADWSGAAPVGTQAASAISPVVAVQPEIPQPDPVRAAEPPAPPDPVIVASDPAPPAAEIIQPAAAPDHFRGSSDPDFTLPHGPARGLFLITQVGYLVMYCAALYKLESAGQGLERFLNIPSNVGLPVIIAAAVCGVAVRLYLLTSIGLRHPEAGAKYHQIFPLLFLLDAFWSASPLLLVEKIGMGLALASVAALAYLPFSQRILMRSIYHSGAVN